MAANDPVLVTGCSSGIGLATTQRLLAAGHTVYATARRPETLDGLARAGARVLALDVTDEASMRTAVEAVEHEHGAVGALVNNAGYGVYGPVEEVDLDDVRAEFETNVFGLGRMCQLVLPGMRRAGRGRIVNISSMGGRLVFPTGGWYHASKYAVEALSDALRLEVKPFGVDVVVVEPGLIRTEFGTTASHGLTAGDEGSAYGGLRSYADELMANAYRSRAAAEPGVVADTIVKAVQARRPRTRYVVTAAAKLQVQTRRLAGDRVWDMAMRQAYRLR
ncbi:oxidoreductase [Kineosporia sp. A_224]|uniref:oxidoreductase n=1 Tax=Kineosporia sp. A_224 TaxID=1962180 RepID=UPI000B4A658A|nr:oxidoreductase [Kineosporia sp. A_224]